MQKTLAVLHPDNEGSLYFERETTTGGTSTPKTENRHYISAPKAAGQGASAFLVITSPGAIVADPVAADLPNTEQRYLHKDQLGSTIATTKPTYSGTAVVGATIIEQLAYEPFGKRRYPAGQFDKTGQIDAQSTPRGFTGHEHLDDLDLIHMNARAYDPDVGRFLSPDPTVPFTQNPQAFNRYAYALNSPTNLVDRNGFEPTLPNGRGGNMHIYTSGDAPVNAPNNAANGAGRTAAEPKGGDGGKAQSGLSQFWNRTGKFGPRNDDSGSPASILKDSGKAMWNGSLSGGALPPPVGMAMSYLTEPLRFDYDTPTYGYAAEYGLPVLAGMGASRLPGLVTNLAKVEAQAAFKITQETSSQTTRVGRWMHPDELAKMRNTGKVQEGGGGQTRVSNPASASTYRNNPKSDVYVEFDVPSTRLEPHSEGTSRIPGPNSYDAKVPGRTKSDYEMPDAGNITEH